MSELPRDGRLSGAASAPWERRRRAEPARIAPRGPVRIRPGAPSPDPARQVAPVPFPTPPLPKPPLPPPPTQPAPAPPAELAENEPEGKQSNSRLLAATGSIALATLVSRITGFMKQALLLIVLGPLVASAYTVAAIVPNMIAEFVLGAVLTAIVVPVLVRAETEDPDRGQAFVRRLFTAAMTTLVIAAILATAAAPMLASLFISEDGKGNIGLTTALLYLLLPAILFYGLSALFTAILNTRQNFKPGAWAPVVNNMVVLAVLAIYLLMPGEISLDPTRMSDPKLLVLGLGVTAGVVAQVVTLVPALRRNKIDLRPLWGLDDRLKSFGAMAVAIVLYVLISQAGMVVATRISSHADEAGPAIYNNAWLLLQLPYGVLGVTVLTALMPRLSRNAAANDTPAVIDDLSVATRMTMLALIPVIGFLTVSGPAVGQALYGYGNFGGDAERLGEAVSYSAFTLIPYSLVLIHLRVFYAREQAWTPTWIVLGITTVKIALSTLAPVLATSDKQVVLLLGVANGLGYTAGAVIGWMLLRRSLAELRLTGVTRTVTVVGAATLVGAGSLFVADNLLGLQNLSDRFGGIGSILRVAFGGTFMMLIVAVILYRARIPEVVAIAAGLTRRIRRQPHPELDTPSVREHEPDSMFDRTDFIPVIRMGPVPVVAPQPPFGSVAPRGATLPYPGDRRAPLAGHDRHSWPADDAVTTVIPAYTGQHANDMVEGDEVADEKVPGVRTPAGGATTDIRPAPGDKPKPMPGASKPAAPKAEAPQPEAPKPPVSADSSPAIATQKAPAPAPTGPEKAAKSGKGEPPTAATTEATVVDDVAAPAEADANDTNTTETPAAAADEVAASGTGRALDEAVEDADSPDDADTAATAAETAPPASTGDTDTGETDTGDAVLPGPVTAPARGPAPEPALRGPKLIPGASVAGGRYRLLAPHGGARGLKFWQAHDVKLDREVALTFVDSEQRAAAESAGDADGPQAVLSRTLRLGRINSPGLARVLDVVRGSSGGIVVAEWTRGRSLREMADTVPSPLGAASAIKTLAAAAEAAHRTGGALSIDHPDRVRISVKGDAVLAFPATLGDADPGADVRGLGAMLYALITAKWPLNETPGSPAPLPTSVGAMPVAQRTETGAPVEPRSIRPDVPFEISAVAVRALEANSGIRTAATVQHILGQAAVVNEKTEMIPALRLGQRSPGSTGHALPESDAPLGGRSNRMVAAMVGLGVLLVAVLGLVGWLVANFLTGDSTNAPLDQQPIGLTTPVTTPVDPGSPAPPPPAPVAAAVASIQVYSPQGTADDPGGAANVLDNNPATLWNSDQYTQPFPALKNGLGLLAKLPEPATLTSVSIDSPSPGTVVEIRAASTDAPSLDQTQVIGRGTLGPGVTRISVTPDGPIDHVLVWITDLSTVTGANQSSIADLTLNTN